jgi:hypothetical protein
MLYDNDNVLLEREITPTMHYEICTKHTGVILVSIGKKYYKKDYKIKKNEYYYRVNINPNSCNRYLNIRIFSTKNFSIRKRRTK